MKKKILFILALAAVLLSACKMKLSENTGTVIIDFGSNERAVVILHIKWQILTLTYKLYNSISDIDLQDFILKFPCK